VNEDTVREIVSKTATKEIHCSAAVNVESTMKFRNPNIQEMGSEKGSAYGILTVDAARVRKIRELAQSA
jgi:copper homeostasis protein CutC